MIMGLCENCKITMCRAERDDVIGCAEFVAKNTNVLTNADRMIKMLQENDAYGLLDWWQVILEDGVPSEDYFKWWLKQPAEE